LSNDVVAQAGSRDDLSKKIHASYQHFRASIMDWSDVAERAFLASRSLG
jgi:TRAP-type mannitol/chloroaromatic compound transport system substrate-binding protein